MKKTITIEHPMAHITLVARRAVPHAVCKKTIRSIEGVLNAALLLSKEFSELPQVCEVGASDSESDKD